MFETLDHVRAVASWNLGVYVVWPTCELGDDIRAQDKKDKAPLPSLRDGKFFSNDATVQS